jgi:predicted RNA-binding Zn ribbon-like protein
VDRESLISGEGQPGDRPPVSGELRLVQDFVNTVDRENRVELLDAPSGLDAWLAHRDLASAPADAAALNRALELREALRELLLANNGHGTDVARAQAALDAAGARARLHTDFSAEPPRLIPAASGIDAALGRIVAIAFAAMLDGSWARLKACPREVCGWAFYDRSTNNRATWCSMQVCGNRVKAGTYYRRRTAQH